MFRTADWPSTARGDLWPQVQTLCKDRALGATSPAIWIQGNSCTWQEQYRWSTTFWTLNTSSGGLLQPVLWVQCSPVHNDRESVGQSRRYIQSARLADDNQVWQRTAIPIRRVWWILHALYAIQHLHVTAKWAQANGEVERQNASIMKRVPIAQLGSWSELEERTADVCGKVPWSTTYYHRQEPCWIKLQPKVQRKTSWFYAGVSWWLGRAR